jgi:hypothetical protein
MLKLCIKYIDLNSKDRHGNTILHKVIYLKYKKKIALDWAIKLDNTYIIKLLKN